MKNLRMINWSPKGLTKDEQAYLRGQVKLLDRLGVLRPAPLYDTALRNKVMGFISAGRYDHRCICGEIHDDISLKQEANALLSMIGDHVAGAGS